MDASKIVSENMKSAEPKRLLSRIKSDREQRFPKLEKSAMFVNITSKEIQMKQMEAFRFANSAFPFFIKMAHHTMDPLLISENEKYKNGEYWGDVTHFLLCNKAHGIPLWRELQKQLRSMDTTFSCRPHISTKMTNTILNHLLNSDNVVDKSFYLSDSVLVQLPFQPILLLQWLSASLFTVLVFENQLTDFYQFPVPGKFKNILLKLHKLLNEAQVGLGYLFDYLQQQIDRKKNIFVGNLEVFEMALNKVIPGVRLGVNDNLFQALRDLKNKCWGNKEQEKCDFELKKGKMRLKKRNFLFNLDFWKGPNPGLEIFGRSNERLKKERKNDHGSREVKPDENMEIMKHLNPVLPGSLSDVNPNELEMSEDFKKRVRKMNNKIGVFQSLIIENDDSGILYDILSTKAKIDSQCAIKEVKCWIRTKFEKSPMIFGQQKNREGPEPVDVKSLISEHPLFSFQEALARIHNININDNTLPECVIGFQKRIKDMVLKCIETHLKMNKFEKEKVVLRDWQVVQYLLPCFVASYQDICASTPPVHKAIKERYSEFIGKLIGMYETDGIRKSTWNNIIKDVKANPILKKSNENKHEPLLKFFKNVSDNFNKKIGIDRNSSIAKFCPNFEPFYEVLTENKNEDHSPSRDIATEPSLYWNWLMWDFFSKMQKALNETPEFVYLTHNQL